MKGHIISALEVLTVCVRMDGLHQMRTWTKHGDCQQWRLKSVNGAGRLVHGPPSWRLWVTCPTQKWHRPRTFCSSVSWTQSQVMMIWRSSSVVLERSRGQSCVFLIPDPHSTDKRTDTDNAFSLLWSYHNLRTEQSQAITCLSQKHAIYCPTTLDFSGSWWTHR